jgi:hypothetical protein
MWSIVAGMEERRSIYKNFGWNARSKETTRETKT